MVIGPREGTVVLLEELHNLCVLFDKVHFSSRVRMQASLAITMLSYGKRACIAL